MTLGTQVLAKTTARCDLALLATCRLGFMPKTTRYTIPGTGDVASGIKNRPRYHSWDKPALPTTTPTVVLS
jgi:hypothetical protein